MLQEYLLDAEGCFGNQGRTLETVGLDWMNKEEIGNNINCCS